MKPTQAEMILRIAENTYTDGDETINEMRRLGTAHLQRIMEDSDLIARAKEINEADKKRFAMYQPQERRPELARGNAASTTLPPPKEMLRKAAAE